MGRLLCHTVFFDVDNDLCAIEGKAYDIIYEDDYGYEIINEMGDKHTLTKESDDEGCSFASWFEVIE